jgi:hypothetical protein
MLAYYNKLLVALLVVVLLMGVVIINLKVFIVHDKLLESSAAWVITYNVGSILVSVI